jgi:AraC-like DNA-binding protein
MSVRNFERVFTREVGTTPSQYVLRVRVEAAQRMLERSNGDLKHVASATGFGAVDVMRRAFVRLLGLTPPVSRTRRGWVEQNSFIDAEGGHRTRTPRSRPRIVGRSVVVHLPNEQVLVGFRGLQPLRTAVGGGLVR